MSYIATYMLRSTIHYSQYFYTSNFTEGKPLININTRKLNLTQTSILNTLFTDCINSSKGNEEILLMILDPENHTKAMF